MTSHILFTLKSCFSFVDERFFSEFLHKTMFSFGHFLWAFLSNFMLNIFLFIAKYLHRGKNGSKFDANGSKEDDKLVSQNSMDFDSVVAAEKESSNFFFSFLSQESKDSEEKIAETEDSASLQSEFNASTLKYQFMAGENVMGFMEEPQTMSFTIQEMFVGSNDVLINNNQIIGVHQIEDGTKSKSEKEFQEFDRDSNVSFSYGSFSESTVEEETPEHERADYSLKTPCSNEILDGMEAENSTKNKILSDEEMDDDISYELQLLPWNEFLDSDLKPEIDNSCGGLVTGNKEVESGIIEGNVIENAEEDIDDEYIELEPRSNDSNEVDENIVSQKGENMFEVEQKEEKETKLMDEGSRGFRQESIIKESGESDSDDDEDEFDILLEHQQLVKQMKMERKNSKVRGLPTISEDEECESPRIVEDLKPLKIDEKFGYKDVMEEIHKFYKSYAEKMRKLDVLNYQSLHAISFLQLKDSQIFMPSKKSLLSSIKPFSLPNLSLFKERRIHDADPTLKSITEMHRDLELVYVGQTCLSWEILHWQYGRLKELLEHDSQAHHSYNQIAGEYQQFQVLLQRFLEDERFNGPRIQNFVKTRCFFRGLLQVPMIKDDHAKDKREIMEDEKDAISISMLADIMKESMQIFWEFLRADKEEANVVPKSSQGSLVNPPASFDSELLMNLRTCLEKKERKLKEIQKSGNCMVKKLQKHQTGESSCNNALLISLVEVKLVSRVLSLSRLSTDHLVWCQRKLNNINFINRKISVEPAFLLFPCCNTATSFQG